jgi:hypothetical protein
VSNDLSSRTDGVSFFLILAHLQLSLPLHLIHDQNEFPYVNWASESAAFDRYYQVCVRDCEAVASSVSVREAVDLSVQVGSMCCPHEFASRKERG